jgi:hypothetical protein
MSFFKLHTMPLNGKSQDNYELFIKYLDDGVIYLLRSPFWTLSIVQIFKTIKILEIGSISVMKYIKIYSAGSLGTATLNPWFGLKEKIEPVPEM